MKSNRCSHFAVSQETGLGERKGLPVERAVLFHAMPWRNDFWLEASLFWLLKSPRAYFFVCSWMSLLIKRQTLLHSRSLTLPPSSLDREDKSLSQYFLNKVLMTPRSVLISPTKANISNQPHIWVCLYLWPCVCVMSACICCCAVYVDTNVRLFLSYNGSLTGLHWRSSCLIIDCNDPFGKAGSAGTIRDEAVGVLFLFCERVLCFCRKCRWVLHSLVEFIITNKWNSSC